MSNQAATRIIVLAEDATARRANLRSEEKHLYTVILRWFAEHGVAPALAQLQAEGADIEGEIEGILARFVERDLVVRDEATGNIISVYPFSGVPTAHRVEIVGARPVYAMCAIDALGIPFMLGRDAVITSADPTTGDLIRIEVQGGQIQWEPQDALVFGGSYRRSGIMALMCCPTINFFRSVKTAQAYEAAHPDIEGCIISQPEAVQTAKQIFAALLD